MSNHCARCALRRQDEISAIRGRSLEGFAPPEVALLRMADAPSNVSDELYSQLRRPLSEEQLIELAASAALEKYSACYKRVFDVGSDGLYRRGVQPQATSSRLDRRAGPR